MIYHGLSNWMLRQWLGETTPDLDICAPGILNTYPFGRHPYWRSVSAIDEITLELAISRRLVLIGYAKQRMSMPYVKSAIRHEGKPASKPTKSRTHGESAVPS